MDVGLTISSKTIIISRSYKWAQKHGYLVPFADPIRVLIEDEISQQSEEYAQIRDTSNWLELLLKTWQDVARDRVATICFTGKMDGRSGVEVSKDIVRYFNDNGVPAAHVDASMCIGPNNKEYPKSYRTKIYDSIRNGKIKFLCGYGVGLEGLDLPNVDTLFWMRPTSNSLLITQAVGRILRLSPGKEDALIVDFTGRDIALTPVGTLFGYQVNPETEQYMKEEEDDDEDELLGGVNVRDIAKPGTVFGHNTLYTVAQIISKSPGDWFSDDNTNTMSLSVSGQSCLAIVPPYYSIVDQIKLYREDHVIDDEQIDEFLNWSHLLFENFTLWHVNTKKKKLSHNGFIAHNFALDVLLADAVQYAYNRIPDHEEIFMGKGKSWKYQPPSDKQRALMRNLKIPEADENVSKGQASKLISHYMTFKPIKDILSQTLTALLHYGIIEEEYAKKNKYGVEI